MFFNISFYVTDLLMDSCANGLPYEFAYGLWQNSLPYRFETWIQTAQNRDRLPYGFGLWIHTLAGLYGPLPNRDFRGGASIEKVP